MRSSALRENPWCSQQATQHKKLHLSLSSTFSNRSALRLLLCGLPLRRSPSRAIRPQLAVHGGCRPAGRREVPARCDVRKALRRALLRFLFCAQGCWLLLDGIHALPNDVLGSSVLSRACFVTLFVAFVDSPGRCNGCNGCNMHWNMKSSNRSHTAHLVHLRHLGLAVPQVPGRAHVGFDLMPHSHSPYGVASSAKGCGVRG